MREDMPPVERNRIESLIDRWGIDTVLMAISEICGAKAEHVAHNWQDTHLAKRWATLEGAVGVIVPKAEGALMVIEGRTIRTLLDLQEYCTAALAAVHVNSPAMEPSEVRFQIPQDMRTVETVLPSGQIIYDIIVKAWFP